MIPKEYRSDRKSISFPSAYSDKTKTVKQIVAEMKAELCRNGYEMIKTIKDTIFQMVSNLGIEPIHYRKTLTEEDRISSVWIGVMNGLLYETNNPNRVFDGIDQMFEQSPYLRTN